MHMKESVLSIYIHVYINLVKFSDNLFDIFKFYFLCGE